MVLVFTGYKSANGISEVLVVVKDYDLPEILLQNTSGIRKCCSSAFPLVFQAKGEGSEACDADG